MYNSLDSRKTKLLMTKAANFFTSPKGFNQIIYLKKKREKITVLFLLKNSKKILRKKQFSVWSLVFHLYNGLDKCDTSKLLTSTRGQLNSEWIYDAIIFPKTPTQNFSDCCPGTLLEGRAEIWEMFGWHFGRNDDLINSFWI